MKIPLWIKKLRTMFPVRACARASPSTDAYLASADDAFLEQKTTVKPLGEMPIANAIGNMCLTHGFTHVGEIAHLRGLQGLKGMAV